jgi:hypothetical protein
MFWLMLHNPHLRSWSVREDNMTCPTSRGGSGNVMPKREVVF